MRCTYCQKTFDKYYRIGQDGLLFCNECILKVFRINECDSCGAIGYPLYKYVDKSLCRQCFLDKTEVKHDNKHNR